MRELHGKLHHCPPEQLLHAVRQRYWPIAGRRDAQKIVRRCLKCFRYRPIIPEVAMGELPAPRLQGDTRAFAVTGVDYAGPIQVTESRRRGKIHVYKAYVAVFVCFHTKAVHLELVTDLSTESFLAAFTARRGLCTNMHSDNGISFVGASRELRELYEFLKGNKPSIASALAEQQIKWSFISPRSPHFGDLWEAAVKVMKRLLYTVTQGQVFTYEEYYPLLTGIEAVLNFRPLTPLTSDPNDLQLLTPAHFLVGSSLHLPIEDNYLETAENRLSRWQHLRKIQQYFWDRWRREYLQELQKRTKWHSTSHRLEVGTVVLLVDDNIPPLQWPMGRIIKIHPGRDGEVRVVTVKTTTSTFKHTIKKVCPLPLEDEDL